MGFAELLQVLRRRWATFLLTLAVVLGVAVASLVLQTPVYEATATFGLIPTESGPNSIVVIGQIPSIAPVYSESAVARETRQLAISKLPPGVRPADVSVRTFKDAPLVLKIVGRSTSPVAAQLTAQAHVDALIDRANAGQVGLVEFIDIVSIQRPGVPDVPVSPRPSVTLLTAAVLGMALATAMAVLFDNRRRTVDDAEAASALIGAPTFGELPSIRGDLRIRSTNDLVSDRSLRVLSESLRDISTSLQLSVQDYRSLLVTSPQGSHGKSTVAFGLAVSIARSGARVLLVDADMRRGRMEQFFKAEEIPLDKAPGLRDLLLGASIEAVVQRTDLATLDVIASGELTDNAGELLDQEFAATLDQLTARYDVVVVDGTPLVPINDARVIAKLVDVTIVVLSAGALTRREVRAAAERLEVIQVEPNAVVLNRSRVKHRSGYYAYLNAGRAKHVAR
jgi:capsular exopolysaccharide synthesis family protein